MNEQLSSRRYEPPIIDLDNKNSSHTLIIDFIGGEKTVLEIGTSTGYISKMLKERGNIVTGIEIDHDAALVAQQHCNRMISGDVETLQLDEIFTPASFDIILCEDVLEHLKKPATVLKKIRKYLKPDGFIVVSLPNFCHGDVLLNILNGDFHYTSMGLLDETHLHFFGLKNIYSVFADCGYQISDLQTTNLDIGTTELKIDREKIPPDLLKFIRSLPNSNVYQFVFCATPSAEVKKPLVDEIDLNTLFYNSIEESIRAGQSPLLQELSARDQHLQEISSQVTNLNQTLAIKDQQLLEVTATAHSMEQAVEDKNRQLLDIAATVHALEQANDAKELQISGINATVHALEQANDAKELQISGINATVHALEQANDAKELQISGITATVHALEQANDAKELQIQGIMHQSRLLKDENDSLKKSISYRLVTQFHRCVIEKLLPLPSKRRSHYDLGLKGGRILVNEGWTIFYCQFKEKLFPAPIARKNVHFPLKTITPVQKPDNVRIIDTCVSVIIPTKNAGSDFERVLEKINCQKGIREIETIIIDSGSCDSTLITAQKSGSRIYEIKPEDFNHGTTRNFGAEKARGSYICFLVQDAIPVGNYWLYSMVDVLEKDQKIAAATCRQLPRSDADLFACFGLWQHYSYTLDAVSDRICHSDVDFDTLPGEEKRRLAGLDDVSCLIRKDIFDKYRFRKIPASEDLDLGKRLIKDGYKNAFLFSVGVIHSHNRDPDYFLRRSYVDTKTVADIVGYQTQEISKGCTLSEILGSVITLYNSLNLTMDTIEHTTNLHTREVTKKILSDLLHNYERELEKKPLLEHSGHCLDDAIHAVCGHINGQPDNSNAAQNRLIFIQYEWVLKQFFEYTDVYDSMDDKKQQFRESLYKIFAVVAGASIASYYLHKSLTSDLDMEISSIDAELSAGV